MKRLPALSTKTLVGNQSEAEVAGPPSPVKPPGPPPATVVIAPLVALIMRTRLLRVSAKYRLLAASTASPYGSFTAVCCCASSNGSTPVDALSAPGAAGVRRFAD